MNSDDSDEYENFILQNVKSISKLLSEIVEWNDTDRMQKNICKEFYLDKVMNAELGGGVTWKVHT